MYITKLEIRGTETNLKMCKWKNDLNRAESVKSRKPRVIS